MLISVVIAEDHDVTREGLRSVVEHRLEARVAATTGDGLAVIPLLREHQPDLLLLDLGLPGIGGIEILRRLGDQSMSVPVIVLSMHGDDPYVARALHYGASGFVLKGSPLQELIDAIQAVMAGKQYLSDHLAYDADSVRAPDAPVERYDALTERERDVLSLIAEGLTSKEIGERLFISPRTVDKHRQNLKEKLGLRNAVELTHFYLRHQPSPPDGSPENG